MAACHNFRVSEIEPVKTPRGLATFFIVSGLIGFAAAFLLTLDKVAILTNPEAQLSCNFSVLIGCSKNLASWQGAILGFPNPLIGIAAWSVVITIGFALLAGATFKRWFWIALNVGYLGAISFVLFLITQSIFVLDVLCPWCMVTWAVTIPGFLAISLYNLKSGIIPVPARLARFAAGAYSWLLVITIGCYLVFAIVAQVQMDFLNRL